MIKIQMAPVLDHSGVSQSGVSQAEYVWIIGQEGGWPVPEDEDKRVARVEVFGPELDYVNAIPGGEVRDSEGTVSKILRCWYRKEAAYVSEQMRRQLTYTPPAA